MKTKMLLKLKYSGNIHSDVIDVMCVLYDNNIPFNVVNNCVVLEGIAYIAYFDGFMYIKESTDIPGCYTHLHTLLSNIVDIVKGNTSIASIRVDPINYCT